MVIRADEKEAVHPPALVPGSRIAVVAPSSPVPRDRTEAGIAVLESWGYETVRGAHLYADDGGFLAGDDGRRAADLSDAFTDPSIDAVWIARGGYGATRASDLVRWKALRDRPVPVLGLSDATALHAALWHRTSVVSLHAPVLVQVGELDPGGAAVAWLRALLAGEAPLALPLDDDSLYGESPRPRTVAGGRATGPLLGGNLAVLCSLIGTVDEPDTRGAVLFLEDVGEAPYKVDRMLMHLLRAGLLDEVEAIVTGRFTGCDVRPGMPPRTVDEVLDDTLGHLGVPVLARAPAGHGPESLALPHGAGVTVDADAGSVQLRGQPLRPR